MDIIKPSLEDKQRSSEIDNETSEKINVLDKEVKDCITEDFTLKEYFDNNGIYHFRLCLDLNDSDEADWEVFDYDINSALLDLGFVPEDI